MKTLIFFLTFLLISFSFAKGEVVHNNLVEIKDTSSNYNDGVYIAKSRGKYTSEPFWGHIQLTVKKGAFTSVKFTIRDSTTHEEVDSMYGVKHYSAIPEYMKQCVNDGHGIEIYPQRLLQIQNLDEVDGISGATWSYNIFKSTTNEALKSGKITGIHAGLKSEEGFLQAFPNPFYKTTKLDFALPNKCYVRLYIYDSQGKIIQKLVDQEKQAGKHSIKWNDCPGAGVYYYILNTGDKKFSGKIVKLKK